MGQASQSHFLLTLAPEPVELAEEAESSEEALFLRKRRRLPWLGWGEAGLAIGHCW